tara:strand:+ start:168 stop:1004 length:837 start_codon:yes stop_codon:yes gene_type:complete
MEEEAVAPDDSGQVASDVSNPSEEIPQMEFHPSHMPAGLREEPSLQTFDSVDKLAKSYVNAVKMIGGNPEHMVAIPQEGESWDGFYNKIGRPEQANGYEFGDENGELDGFREFAHNTGLTQEQANSILNLYGEIQEEQETDATNQLEELRTNTTMELQKEWGKNYDGKLDYAKRAFAQFATPELIQVMDDSGLGNHPEMLRAFSKVGEIMGEDSLVVGTGLGTSQLSPQQAQAEIQALYSDKEFSASYRDNKNPGHKQAMNKMDKLFKTAYPNQRRVR